VATPGSSGPKTRWYAERYSERSRAGDKTYEFMFVWAPLKIVGGTGSPGNPVALY